MDTQSPSIRVISLCLFSYGNRILVKRGYDSTKQIHFCRPLGGSVNFGEPVQDTVRREIRRQLGQEIVQLRLVSVVENTFELEGKPGHEVAFIFDAVFQDTTLYTVAEINGPTDEDGNKVTAFWTTLPEIAARGESLVPASLVPLMSPQLQMSVQDAPQQPEQPSEPQEAPQQ